MHRLEKTGARSLPGALRYLWSEIPLIDSAAQDGRSKEEPIERIGEIMDRYHGE